MRRTARNHAQRESGKAEITDHPSLGEAAPAFLRLLRENANEQLEWGETLCNPQDREKRLNQKWTHGNTLPYLTPLHSLAAERSAASRAGTFYQTESTRGARLVGCGVLLAVPAPCSKQI